MKQTLTLSTLKTGMLWSNIHLTSKKKSTASLIPFFPVTSNAPLNNVTIKKLTYPMSSKKTQREDRKNHD